MEWSGVEVEGYEEAATSDWKIEETYLLPSGIKKREKNIGKGRKKKIWKKKKGLKGAQDKLIHSTQLRNMVVA